jgi:hypothetical protein
MINPDFFDFLRRRMNEDNRSRQDGGRTTEPLMQVPVQVPADATRTPAPVRPRMPTIGPSRAGEVGLPKQTPLQRALQATQTVGSFVPGVAEGMDARNAVRSAMDGNVAGAVGNAALAGLGLLGGRPLRKVWGAWHGSPRRDIKKFADEFLPKESGMQMAGRGHYVAGDDVRGAGRAQAEGYVGDGNYLNVSGTPIRFGDLLGSFGESYAQKLGLREGRPVIQAARAFAESDPGRRRLIYTPSGAVRQAELPDPDRLREDVLSLLSRKAERATDSGEMFDLMRAAKMVEDGSVATNRGGLYRLAVDADKRRMINFDTPLERQPEFVRRSMQQAGVLDEIKQPQYKFGSDILDFMDEMLGDDQATRNFLQRQGIEGVSASGGTQGLRRSLPGGRAATSRQYTIFDPERIKILEMLSAAGLVSASAELAQLRKQQATQPPPEG